MYKKREGAVEEVHMQAETCGGSSGQARSHLICPLSSVLDTVLLQQAQVQEPLTTPHALVLLLPGMHTVVLVEVLALLEGLLA